MPSPFPGMDPYIENPDVWSNFHGNFITALQSQLNQRLPPRFFAAGDLHVWGQLADLPSPVLIGAPDTYVTERPIRANGNGQATAMLTAPVTTRLRGITQKGPRYIRIFDKEHHRVVTVIEVLSPGNKNTSATGEAYRAKRDDYLDSNVNLIEIDFLRYGVRPPLGDPPPPPMDYYVLVARPIALPDVGLWPISVRESLPVIPVPLTGDVTTVSLDLRWCLDRAYDDTGFPRRIDYTQPPVPPMREPDATWARELLASRTPPSST
jgi:Protein of unknown function (DUF4058)